MNDRIGKNVRNGFEGAKEQCDFYANVEISYDERNRFGHFDPLLFKMKLNVG